jgi:hypothetical protein
MIAGSRKRAMFWKLAHGNLAAYFQVGGQFFTGPKGIPGPDRVAVHGGTGVRGQVFWREKIYSADSAQCFIERQGYFPGRAGWHVLLQENERFFKAYGIRTPQHITAYVDGWLHEKSWCK